MIGQGGQWKGGDLWLGLTDSNPRSTSTCDEKLTHRVTYSTVFNVTHPLCHFSHHVREAGLYMHDPGTRYTYPHTYSYIHAGLKRVSHTQSEPQFNKARSLSSVRTYCGVFTEQVPRSKRGGDHHGVDESTRPRTKLEPTHRKKGFGDGT